ncbi:MAG: ParB/RepB/Spo0J family partition protein, partial [Methylobacterium sp.]
MNDDLSKNRLGRGLAALLGDVGAESAAEKRLRSQRRVPIEFLRPNPMNPRVTFHEAELQELAQSIRERDIIQPIVVRGVPGVPDAFEIIAGERRWRGAQRAGLHDVPVVIIEADDKQALELAIIENVQRAAAGEAPRPPRIRATAADTTALEQPQSDGLGLAVSIE